MPYPILDWTLGPILRKRINKFEGVENIPKDKNFILAANHRSTGDSLFILALFAPIIKDKIYFIAGENVWKIYGKKVAENFFGMIPKNENNKSECLVKAKEYLLAGKTVGIFPEGTILKQGLIKAKTGMARLALWTKIPVLPISVKCHIEKKMGPIAFLRVIKSKEPVEIKIGQPMYFKDLYDKEITHDMLCQATSRVMKKIAEMLGEEYKY